MPKRFAERLARASQVAAAMDVLASAQLDDRAGAWRFLLDTSDLKRLGQSTIRSVVEPLAVTGQRCQWVAPAGSVP